MLAIIAVVALSAVLAATGNLLGTVIVSGALDGVHPCGIGVLLFFIAFLLALKRDRKEILLVGLAYISGVFAAYLGIGLGIMQALTFLPSMLVANISVVLLVILALVSALDAFRGTTTLKMPTFSRPWVQNYLSKATIPAAIAAGFLVGLCAFPCAGGIYVAIIGLLSARVDLLSTIAYLILYNLAFVLPLILLLLVSSDSKVIASIEEWEKRNRKFYKLFFAAFMLALAAFIYFGWLGGGLG